MRSSQQPSPLCGQPDKLPPNPYTPASFHSLPCDIPCKSCVAWGETKDCALKLSAATTSCFRFILKKSFFFFPQAKKLLQCFLALRMEITNYSKSSVRQIPPLYLKSGSGPTWKCSDLSHKRQHFRHIRSARRNRKSGNVMTPWPFQVKRHKNSACILRKGSPVDKLCRKRERKWFSCSCCCKKSKIWCL